MYVSYSSCCFILPPRADRRHAHVREHDVARLVGERARHPRGPVLAACRIQRVEQRDHGGDQRVRRRIRAHEHHVRECAHGGGRGRRRRWAGAGGGLGGGRGLQLALQWRRRGGDDDDDAVEDAALGLSLPSVM